MNPRTRLAYNSRFRLNAVCPYYTMFPLEFPMNVLRTKPRSIIVLDPFCGRGTTNFAARVLGFRSYGFDTSRVAVAIARAKLASPTADRVVALADRYLNDPGDYELPQGEFWHWAYHPITLDHLCRIRSRLQRAKTGDAAHLLRAVMLGALHGPLAKQLRNASYFSNQMPRTFASKPAYSVNYWRKRAMRPPQINVTEVIRKRTEAVLTFTFPAQTSPTAIRRGDATKNKTFNSVIDSVDLVITSPPYYGLRTYVEDQWLRNWFLGGSDTVTYGGHPQLDHGSEENFAKDLARVWDRVAEVGSERLRMLVRFGSIGSRSTRPGPILRRSLELSCSTWKIKRSRNCGSAAHGKRQADQMGNTNSPAHERDYSISLISR